MSKYTSASARAAQQPPQPAKPAAAAAAAQRSASVQPAIDVDELPDEVSEPFFKGLGVVYVDVDDNNGKAKCDLCSFARKHPPPPYDDPAAHPPEQDRRWGVMHDCMDDVTLCKQDEEEQHAFHAGCLRAFILANKAKFRQPPVGCPVCDKTLEDLTRKAKKPAVGAAAGSGAKSEEKKGDGDDDDGLFGDDEDATALDEVGQTGGKKRKRDKQMYSVWVHVRQATGLALVGSDKTMNPVAYVSVFGKTVQTARGDGGKTYSCVWNESFSFSKLMDEDEFSREVIQIRVEDHAKIWRNTLIGFVKFQAETVRAQPNHEFYQLQYPIVNMAANRKTNPNAVTMQGQLEVSVCVLAEQDIKDDPTLPRHIYDAEVEMWAELQNKAEVMDFDINKNYLQNNLDLKKEQDAARKLTMFDIVHVRVYRAEDLPKLDQWQGWVDAFIELEYKGLMDKGAKLKSKPVMKSANPTWNIEFTLPLVHGAPLVYNAFELVVKNHTTLGSDEWIGKCALNLSDVLALPPGAPPMWKSLYQDLDGKAPTYRGRVLIEVSVESAQKDAKMYSLPCSPLREELLPPAGSYRLDVEVLEGLHLLENYPDYQVDITLGHSMTVGAGGSHPCSEETSREREKGGKAWATVESDCARIKGANKTVIPFLTKKSLTLHNLPYPRRVDLSSSLGPTAASLAIASQQLDAKLERLPESLPLSPTGTVRPHLPVGGGLGYTGDASALSFHSVREDFNNNTCLLDYKSMMPDLIIYVSKKGGESGRKQCVGYIRVPLNGLKRPTENWEHGEDMTILDLWNPDSSARAIPLKPLVELYQLTSGFLLFKATLTPVSGAASSVVASQHLTTRLEPVPRQRYKFVANVYQAKDMASVDSSGLSSPFVTVQIGDAVAMSKHRPLTCNPLWFEALSGEVDLPVNLLYAPDFAITAYHKGQSMFKFNDPKTFMGRADVPAHVASTSQEASTPAWYPLQFEEHQYGNILLSFRLTPTKDMIVDVVQNGLDELVSGWENYAVEVSALDLRGKIAARHKLKKVDPTYQIECWGDVQNYAASAIAGDKFTVYLRKPSNPVFYSSVNFRLYEGKEMTAVCSIPISKILRSGMGWYKLMELILRDEKMTQKRVVRKWRAFITRKNFIDPRTIRRKDRGPIRTEYGNPRSPSAAGEGKEESEGGVRDHRDDDESGDEDVAPSAAAGQRFKFKPQDAAVAVGPASPSAASTTTAATELTSLRGAAADQAVYSPGDVTIDVADELGESSSSPKSKKDTKATAGAEDDLIATAASKPRMLDAEGNEVFEEKDLRYLQCAALPNKDAGNPFETHWRLECEYEMLPLVNDPFLDVDLWVGKDEIHSTFLDKLFSRGKQSVGRLRGHFFGYQVGTIPRPGSAFSASVSEHGAGGELIKRTNPLFDADKYFNPLEYCVRVYILRGLQLACGKGKASGCDPFVSVSMSGGEAQKTKVLDGTLNPQFYECFDFLRVPFPSLDSSLNISLFNDNTLFSAELVGQTDISLENRLFSKPWNAGQKPIERRALKRSKTGRLPQGFIETVVQIIPMHEVGTRALDYLLNPPKRMPWEMRVILWNAKNVTAKKIYKNEGQDCCCYDICAPPNQSDIKLVAGMSGSKQKPQPTDTHPRSIDGTGNWSWRCVFDVELPSPQMLCNLKVQVWNINWNPDDCIAEAVIPLWGFFELARRTHDADPTNIDKAVARIPRQWVHLTHPQNSDVGDVEIEVQLLPKELAGTAEFKAAAGEDGFDPLKNSGSQLLAPPNRPDDSFPWYRIDLQILWRCKYIFRKIRWYLLAALLLFLAGVAGLAYAKYKMLL